MAKATPHLIAALRRAADKISKENNYQWGHMGQCNCGHLAQELTNLSSSDIHRIAMQRSGDWNDQCEDYCETSNMPIDILISELLSKGLAIEDLMKLEKLSDSEVLNRLPAGISYLEKNNKKHVAIYMNTWAKLLENQFLAESHFEIYQEGIFQDEFIVK